MSHQHRAVRMVSFTMLGALALATMPAPVVIAGGEVPLCRVRNVTQGTSSRSFRVVVVLAHDGDHLRVRGDCPTRGMVIDKDLDIQGLGVAPTLDGQARYRVLRIRKGAVVTLRHLVLTRGRARSGYQGGGVINRGTLTLVDSLVTKNDGAYLGGGIYNIGTLTLIRSRVSDHGTGYPHHEGGTIQGMGGGIFNAGIATLEDSVVSHNATDYDGGGIKNTGTMTLTRSRVSNNGSDFGAPGGQGPGSGGIVNTGRLVLVDSRVTGNGGAQGGGIGNTGSLRLIRSIVSGNGSATETGGGGGIYNGRRGTVVLDGGSRVTDNNVSSSSGGGGGIFNGPGGTVTLKGGSRVADNSSNTRGGGILNRGSLILRDSTVSANTATEPGGGIFNGPSGMVALQGSSSVTGNAPDDCVGTPAC